MRRALLALLVGGCYDPSLACRVSCANGEACPSGLTCLSSSGLCAEPGGTCGGPVTDAGTVDLAVLRDAPASCGNQLIDPEEDCDDGNMMDDDGCLTTCQFAFCGDGSQRSGVEECDDGNANDNDGCSSRCVACDDPSATQSFTRNGHCYTYHSAAIDHAAAETFCETRPGRTLVVFADANEDGAVRTGLALTALGSSHWIGLDRLAYPGTDDWRWQDGAPLSFDNWMVLPGAGTGEECAVEANVVWDSDNCGVLHGVVCEDGGWDQRAGHAYLFYWHPVGWDEANLACASVDAHLATITSGAENDFLSGKIREDTWVGLHDVAGTMEWSDGEGLTFDDWRNGDPIVGTDGCGQLTLNHWHEDDCLGLAPFICERDP